MEEFKEFMTSNYPKEPKMKTHYCSDEDTFVQQADLWLQQRVTETSAKSLYLPAGETPKLLYKHWSKNQPDYLKGLELYQIDEVLSERQPQMFEKFFIEHLKVKGIRVVPPSESNGVQADLAILGLGKNGHLAFHEPSLPREFFFGEVELEKVTQQTLQLERTAKGLTYGLKAFMATKATLLLVRGSGKQQVYSRFLENTGAATVNGLRLHSDLTIVAMEEFRAQH
ncbi:MAG: 6-phosphogluconolactonase [Bdellovibrionales bacterium]|nr:6-phosphogluconolactonase [Bdellovibrionales bacterium]